MQDLSKIYDSYLPLKSLIRRLSVSESFYVIWAYSRNIQTGKIIPNDISLHPMYVVNERFQKGVHQWTLETLAKEILLHSHFTTQIKGSHESLKDQAFFSKAINAIYRIENVISSEFISPENVIKELSRIAHRQFKWQQDVTNPSYLMRYYSLFSFPELSHLVEQTFSLSVEEIFMFNLFFTHLYLNTHACKLEFQDGTFKKKIDDYIHHFSADHCTLREEIITEHVLDERYLYNNSTLRKFPLIRLNVQQVSHLYCPLPTLLFWRVTSGIYYDVVSKRNFNVAFGKSLENYVGTLLNKVYRNTHFGVIKESKYVVSKSEEDTVDWILNDNNAAIFIECKAKRMTQNSKIHLTDDASVTIDIAAMAKNVVKLYKTISDYSSNFYLTLPFTNERRIYPVIVTPESWFIFDNDHKNKLFDSIKSGLSHASIPAEVLETMPFTLCNLHEFESMIQVIKYTGVLEFFEPKVRNIEKRDFQIGTYVGNQFPEIPISPVFQDEYDELVTRSRALLKDLLSLSN